MLAPTQLMSPPSNKQTTSPSSSPPIKSPSEAPRTHVPSIIVNNQSMVNNCPLVCVVPIKTKECPPHGHKLKQCFGSSIIGLDELCLATYGECDTSPVSANDCGRSYNVFRRIDCSLLEGLHQSNALEHQVDSSQSTAVPEGPVLANSTINMDTEYWDFDSSLSYEYDTSPTAKPTLGFGGMVWWENISSSVAQVRPIHTFTTILSIGLLAVI